MVSDMQRRIELSVTGGVGYDSRTDFSNCNSFYSRGLGAEDVKNTRCGMYAHLRKLDCPEVVKHSERLGFLYSSGGKTGYRKMDIVKISRFGAFLNSHRNNKAVRRAYEAEAERRGKTDLILCEVVKMVLGKDVFDIVDFGIRDIG